MVDFPFLKKDYGKIEVLNKICINVFCYENKIIYPLYLSGQCFSDCLDLLLISNEFTSHYVYIKDFNGLMFNKTMHRGKKYIFKSCLQCFSSENVLKEHRKDCLLINKGQNVKLEKGFIEFKNFNNQIPVPFKIYADFDCLLKGCDVFLTQGKNKTIFHVALLITLFVLIINSVKTLCCIEEKMQLLNLRSVFLESMVIVDL